MKKTDEEIIINTNRNIRNYKASYIVIAIFVILGFKLWEYIGAIFALALGILVNMINGSLKGLRLWNRCEYDYNILLSKGYDINNALLIISKSFNSKLSDQFHQRVVEKFPTLNEVVVFYTGALPENTTDEEWANECLEKTTIEKSPSGSYKYKAKTKW